MTNNDIYLTSDKKTYYMEDFAKVKVNTHWPLDKDLEPYLVIINNNNLIQTLYSQNCKSDSFTTDLISYLEICYSQKLELKIFREVIPSLLYQFNKGEERLNYLYIPPGPNQNYQPDKTLRGIGCIDDNSYFQISHIRFVFYSFNQNRHAEFWQTISLELSKLNC